MGEQILKGKQSNSPNTEEMSLYVLQRLQCRSTPLIEAFIGEVTSGDLKEDVERAAGRY